MTHIKAKKLLGIDTNYKTAKGQKQGYMTGILYLAPANLSGFEVCPQRSPGCTAACLNTAGRGGMNCVQLSRLNKTLWYFDDRDGFMWQLIKDIEALVRKAKREGFTPVVRLNGTSDIPWERVTVPGADNIMGRFPDVQFYDYTKITKRALAHARGDMPSNYHLTFSMTEANDADCREVIEEGGNVAAVFAEIPSTFQVGTWDHYTIAPVVDGDESDLRFNDSYPQGMRSLVRTGVVIGLKAKGKARKDTSGFVR